MKTERQSNIELLRIVATFFIIIVHCNGWFLWDRGEIYGWSSGGLYIGAWRIFVQSVTCIGVNVFILISGYFSIKPKPQSLVNLFSILFFFYVGGYIYDCLLLERTFKVGTFVRNCLAFSRENWFVQCYLFLLLLSPVLNKFVENTTKQSLRTFVIIYSLCAFYFGCIHNSQLLVVR